MEPTGQINIYIKRPPPSGKNSALTDGDLLLVLVPLVLALVQALPLLVKVLGWLVVFGGVQKTTTVAVSVSTPL